MKKGRRKVMAEVLRATAEADGRSIFALSRSSGVPYSVLYRFLKGDKEGRKRSLTLENVDKLAEALGLELRPKRETR